MSVGARSMEEGSSPEELDSMTLMEHLKELRSRLIRSVLAVAAGGLAMWFIYPYGVDTLRSLLESSCPAEAECRVMATSPIQALSTRLTVSAYGGIALALPFLLWQLWQFITPGLYKRERRLAAPFVIFSVVVFLLGVGIAWLTRPQAINLLSGWGLAEPGWNGGGIAPGQDHIQSVGNVRMDLEMACAYLVEPHPDCAAVELMPDAEVAGLVDAFQCPGGEHRRRLTAAGEFGDHAPQVMDEVAALVAKRTEVGPHPREDHPLVETLGAIRGMVGAEVEEEAFHPVRQLIARKP